MLRCSTVMILYSDFTNSLLRKREPRVTNRIASKYSLLHKVSMSVSTCRTAANYFCTTKVISCFYFFFSYSVTILVLLYKCIEVPVIYCWLSLVHSWLLIILNINAERKAEKSVAIWNYINEELCYLKYLIMVT